MPAGVKGSYTYAFSIEGREIKKLNRLTIEEQVDLKLPTAVASVSLTSDEELELLTEGNEISLRVGSENEEQVYSFKIVSATISVARGSYEVDLGAIAQPEFNSKTRARSFKSSSVEVLQSVLGEYFSVKAEAKSDDRMVWIQTALDSDRAFALRVLQHSFVPGDDTLFVALMANGEALITTYRKLLQQEALKVGMDDQSELKVSPALTYQSSVPAYLASPAYLQMDLKSSKSELLDPRPEPILAPSSGDRYVQTRLVSPSFYHPDLHPNYWLSLSKNAEIRSQMRSLQYQVVNTVKELKDWITPGKLVDLNLPSWDNPKSRMIKLSGKGIVTKVSTVLVPGSGFRQVLEVSRDAHSL